MTTANRKSYRATEARACIDHGHRPGRYAAPGFFEGTMVPEPGQKPATEAEQYRSHYKWATGMSNASVPGLPQAKGKPPSAEL